MRLADIKYFYLKSLVQSRRLPIMDGETQRTMLIAIIQSQDAENAIHTLEQIGVVVEKLPSMGGFLGRRNVTLLIGVQQNRKQAVLDGLNETCSQRVEYIAVPLEAAPLPMPTPTPISVGGATIFELDIDHYEEI
jgi:uncharacterized protein YaaQ